MSSERVEGHAWGWRRAAARAKLEAQPRSVVREVAGPFC